MVTHNNNTVNCNTNTRKRNVSSSW